MDEVAGNPYLPPVETPDFVRPPPDGSLTSAHDSATVQAMSKWMRIVATIQFILAALAMLWSCTAASTGLAVGGGALLLFVGAHWLHKAATHFHDSVTMNDATSLAFGFSNLRRYLILWGVIGLFGVISNVVSLAIGK